MKSKAQPSVVDLGDQAECTRCGELVTLPSVPLKTIMQLQLLPREQHAAALMSIESISVEQAVAWVHHKYHSSCPEKVAHCPNCGSKLRTWRAKICFECNHSWR